MPRPGGEADKLGNYYEGIWTADSLLDLIANEAIKVTLEPFDRSDAQGIEFQKFLPDGTVEYHSVKRQHIGTAWSLRALTGSQQNGRSILSDLFQKLALASKTQSVFVSQTGANELLELCERARRSRTPEDFKKHLETAKHLNEDFQKYILPASGGNSIAGFENLKRIRAISIEEQELLKRVSQKALQWIYRPDGQAAEADDIRHILCDFVLQHLGQAVDRNDILQKLERHGYSLRIWAADANLLARLAHVNDNYLASIQGQFINGKIIPRTEAREILSRLLAANAPKAEMIVGSAGLGKSSIIAEIAGELRNAAVPFICIRLDSLPHVITTERLGRELSLPMSPTFVIAGVANGGNCVLVVDQLDALSLVSGRNDHLWPVFEQLIREANQLPNMRILLGCRAFDLEHDQRLRALTGEHGIAQTVPVTLLDITKVHECIAESGGDPKLLKPSEAELLRVPFHLQIFLQAGAPSFRSLQDLFDAFWERKRSMLIKELNDPRSWEDCISVLAEALSHGATNAPADLLDSLADDAKILASNGVLVLESRKWRFFHETFGDYAFARKFVREGRNLLDLLTHGPTDQHLFRRAQVRQILSYQRDRDQTSYLQTLRNLLDQQKVRLHIKKLILEWLSALPDPRPEEWKLLHPLLRDPVFSSHLLSVLWDKIPWFDLLNRLNEWPVLISDDELGDQFARILGHGLLRHRPNQIARLYSSLNRGNIETQRRLSVLFRFGTHYSRDLFDLALDCYRDGLLDDLSRHDLLPHGLVEDRPEYAVEFLAAYLDRIKNIANSRGERNPFVDRENYGVEMRDIKSIAEKVPLLFVQNVAPRLHTLTVENSLPEQDGIIRDDIWKWLTFGSEHSVKDALFFSTARALTNAASRDPLIVGRLIEPWQNSRHQTIAILLMSAWSGHGAAFAETAVGYLLKHPQFMDLGYTAMMGNEGNLTAAVSRDLLRRISPHISDESFKRLETAIGHIHREGPERMDARARYISLLLLRALSKERLSRDAVDLLEKLDDEFPGADIALPSREPIGAQFVEQTVRGLPFETLTDDDWLNLLKVFSHQPPSILQNGRPVEAWNLVGPLRTHARAEPKRFSELALRMADDCLPIFFSTILDSIVGDAADGKHTNILVDIDVVLATIERLHALGDRPCGQAICSAIYKLAGEDLPPRLIQILCEYAEGDSDPSGTDNENEGNELVNRGINTVRGSGADAVARLLFKHSGLVGHLRPTIDRLIVDASLSVRAVAIHALIALLNVDRESAVRSFLAICENEPRVWGSHHVEHFIYYSTFTHYAKIRDLLIKMAFGPDSEVKKVASAQICLAGFRHQEAQQDSIAILNGDETNRQAAAEIYAQNWFHASIRDICTKNLRGLFNDPAPAVRRATDFWDNHLHQIAAEGDWSLFQEYIASKAFTDEPGVCLYQLKGLPTVSERIILQVADRAIVFCRSEIETDPLRAHRFSSYTPVLIVRLYHQTGDEKVKVHCLDLLDTMIALGWNEAAAEIAKSDP
jgi:hypothetical protein